jgi:S-adenosylmethionine/arginine decarboxylase-like enzyme
MKHETVSNLGSHVMLDCYGCPADKLADVNLVLNVLDLTTHKIGLKKAAPPQVFKYHDDEEASEWGVSGVVQVNQAHVSVHTFPDKGHAFIDVFSNRNFNADSLQEELLRLFGAAHHEVRTDTHVPEEAVLPTNHLAGQLPLYN